MHVIWQNAMKGLKILCVIYIFICFKGNPVEISTMSIIFRAFILKIEIMSHRYLFI